MEVFVGQTRGDGAAMRALREAGIGEITQPDEYPPRRSPWMLDNGAWKASRAGQRPDGERLASVLREAIAADRIPLGVAVPDLVAGGRASLAFSLAWLDTYGSEFAGQRWYLAVQDGMIEDDVAPHLSTVHGLFVDGSTGWKLATGGAWSRLAKSHGKACHVGRAGSVKRLRWAREIGATSADSSMPLWSIPQLMHFLREVKRPDAQGVALLDPNDVAEASRMARDLSLRIRGVPERGKTKKRKDEQICLWDTTDTASPSQ